MKEDPERVVRDVGRRIAELRVERGWTQQQFAERLGVINASYVSDIERGLQNFTMHTLVAIARALGVATIELLKPPAGSARRMPAGRKARARSR